MKSFDIKLRTPEKVLFEGKVESLTVIQADGVRTFLACHEDCMGYIVGGVCHYLLDDKNVFFVTFNVFFVVDKGVVSVNSSIIEYGDDYDTVMATFSHTIKELRDGYVKSRQEYTDGRVKIARALTDKQKDFD